MSNIMTAPDKQRHFLVMFVATLGTSLLTRNTWIAGAIALCVGIAKETYDATIGTAGFSIDDMAANCLGIFAAMLLFISIQATDKKEE